jgi:hypothetical protein
MSRSIKRTLGIVSQGTLFDELMYINKSFAPRTAIRTTKLQQFEKKLDAFAETAAAASPKVHQIVINMRVLLAYYKARSMTNAFERNQEYYRLHKEEMIKVKQRLPGEEKKEGSLHKSAVAVYSADIQLYEELLRDPEIAAVLKAAEHVEVADYLQTLQRSSAANREKKKQEMQAEVNQLLRSGAAKTTKNALMMQRAQRSRSGELGITAELQQELVNNHEKRMPKTPHGGTRRKMRHSRTTRKH